MGQVADEVFAIERHEELASLAKRRMESLGYDNVTIIHGDGTKGLPASAPFDAIIAAASGPDVPTELTSQLAIGGRLVMPVGEPLSIQQLVGVTRARASAFGTAELGSVPSVPLLGVHGFRSA